LQANGHHKQAGVALLISDKADFRLKSIRRDNEGHFILMKGIIHQKEISILNIHTPNTGAHIYPKKTLMVLRALIDSNTVLAGELNTPPIDRSSRQKIAKKLQNYSTR
jgi:hypothetical protein